MQTEIIHKKINETYQVILETRGASGLQLNFKVDNEKVAVIKRLDNLSRDDIKPGDPVKAIYNIQGLKKGNVKITFYETQPWNKSFKEIVVKEIALIVD